MPPAPIEELKLRRRLAVDAILVFQTGWRIGTGREGTTMSDLGVLLDPSGLPLLPGSSLKGRLRGTCEALAPALNRSTCLLNAEASGVKCVSDVRHYSSVRQAHAQAIRRGPAEQLDWIARNTCDVCKLFGSPVRAARLRCADGRLANPEAVAVQIRDGVVLDRDSHTAVSGLKYDYETLPAGTRFEIRFDLDNPTPADEALFGAALFEWAAGSSIGGFTSRGLGRFRVEQVKLQGVDLDDTKQRIRYLTTPDPAKRLTDLGDWQTYLQPRITQFAEGGPAHDA
jgi:CRISPR-associated RAMP protein (TIGR02581 family)